MRARWAASSDSLRWGAPSRASTSSAPSASRSSTRRARDGGVVVRREAQAEPELGVVLEQRVRPRRPPAVLVGRPGRGREVPAVDRRAARGVGDHGPVAEELGHEPEVGGLAAPGAGTGELEQRREELRAAHRREVHPGSLDGGQGLEERDVLAARRDERLAPGEVDRPAGRLGGRHRPLGGHHVAAGEDARRSGHHRGGHDDGAVGRESDPGDRAEEGGVALLAEREDQAVGGEGLEASGRVRDAGVVELHRLHDELVALEGADGAQPVDRDALGLGLGRLLGVGGHLRPGAPVDDEGIGGAEAPGCARRVHRRVAAAVDRDAAAERRPLALGHGPEERHRVENAPGVARGDVDALRQMGADRDEHGVERSLAPLGLEVLDPVAAHDAHAKAAEALDLRVEHVAWQPVGGDAVAHHPARLRAGVADLDLVPPAGEVVGGGQSARTGTDDEHPPARGRRRPGQRPATLQREVAEEALERVDRHRLVELRPVAGVFAGVVADAPLDRGERVVGHEELPGLLVTARLDRGEPRLDVLAGRARRVAGGQEVDVDGSAGSDWPGPRPTVDEIGQGREVGPSHGSSPGASGAGPCRRARAHGGGPHARSEVSGGAGARYDAPTAYGASARRCERGTRRRAAGVAPGPWPARGPHPLTARGGSGPRRAGRRARPAAGGR